MENEQVVTTVVEGNPPSPTVAELELAASEFLGMPPVESEQEPTDEAEPSEESAPEPTDAKPVAGEAAQATEAKPEVLSDEEKALLNEIRTIKEVTGTPFKGGVKDVIEAWKNATGELTKQRQATKPYEQFLTRLQNPDFREAAERLMQFTDNPQLAQAYLNQSSPSARPNPRTYNLDDPAEVERYDRDMDDYLARTVDSRIQTRLAPLEGQRILEQRKFEFKQQFPDVDADALIERAIEVTKINPIVNLHKALDYDSMKAKMEAKIASMESDVRVKVMKELTAKIDQAGRTTTPQASAPVQKPTIDEILNTIRRSSVDAAAKKYGLQQVEDAIAEDTNRNFA